MKKILSVSAIMASVTASAVAANLENPLYLPASGEIYSKTTFGIMYKVTDGTDNQRWRDHNGKVEFPIWRPMQDFGYGITDRWAIQSSFGYTYDYDIDRKGFHLGRIGLNYRVIKDLGGFVWDLYGDFHLGGIEKMRGSLEMSPVDPGQFVFSYDNYSNGRWGGHFGTRFGRTWSKLTTSLFVEGLRTWGNHNNEIDISVLRPLFGPYGAVLPNKISVDVKSTWEINAGANVFYQMTNRWSGGLGFKYNYHATNGLDAVHTELPAAVQPYINGLLSEYKSMKDHFNEYILGFTIAYQLRDGAQIAWYLEDTYDTGARLSANTTDLKVETGLRFNFAF